MSDLREAVGERIREVREKAGLSMEALGSILGKGKGAVFKYEKGQSDPETLTLARIAEIGDVSLDWLITGKERVRTQEPARLAEGLEKDLVRIVIEAVEEGLGDLHLELKPDKKAQLVITLCEMFEEEKQIDKPTILRLIKLAA
ncbi:helix-turn-helix domain-containing protein [Desulfuromonas sp. TF]|uniref:helix-turn-helix domain-containing protein n=1 Tax=Desulfuromonas sp. TF TaxID=1232410 RepID=UPI00040B77C3|nr:helix-turn-helix transcriptional regulator [Desulfuromonas sp. TF]